MVSYWIKVASACCGAPAIPVSEKAAETIWQKNIYIGTSLCVAIPSPGGETGGRERLRGAGMNPVM